MGHNLRFGVLGPVQVLRDGVDLAVGPPQQQSMLTMLLLAEGRAVSAAKLVDGLWGTEPPGRAIGALRNYVHQLRRILEPDPALPTVLRSVGSGYLLDVDADLLDTGAFEQIVAHADRRRETGALAEASALLHEALSLHRGEPLAGVPGPYAARQRARLAERRLAVVEERLDLDLAAGRHAEVVGELGELVAAHPLRERLLAQRMTALYRCGQRTAALDAFTAGRRVLLAELDIEPGAELRELHQRILVGQQPPSTVPNGHPRTARPAQLPATIADFTGRAEIAAELAESVLSGAGSAMSITVLSGLGGVGKTALAVAVANRLTDNFPDGQLYAELHGVDELPTPPEQVLKSFLIALGVAERTVPDGIDERSALLRSTLAGRKVLLVLDNARNARQVMALLPGTAGCAVLVTSRAKLTSLSGARKFELPVFDEDEALALLRRIAGPRARDDVAARAIVQACDRLPLAVRISASRLVFRPNWTMTLLAERLSDRRNRLDELRLSDLAVAGTFQLSYDQLEPCAARAFRLLSLSQLRGFSRYSAAAMLDTSPAEAERLCEDLVELSLLESSAAGRYRYHDLVRLFARRQARAAEPAAERLAAMSRLLEFHLDIPLTTVSCGLDHDVKQAAFADVSYGSMPIPDMSAARAWLTSAEFRVDRDAVNALYRLAQRVELDAIAGMDVVVARALSVRFGPADEHSPPLLGKDELGYLDADLARIGPLLSTDDERTHAQFGFMSATSALLRGAPFQARTAYLDALARCRSVGDVRGEIITSTGLARATASLGNRAGAVELGEQAARLAREHGDPDAEKFALNVLAQLAGSGGDTELFHQLRADMARLWALVRQPRRTASWLPSGIAGPSRRRTDRGDWLGLLGHALADLDRPEQARACWQQAIATLSGLAHPATEELRTLVRFG